MLKKIKLRKGKAVGQNFPINFSQGGLLLAKARPQKKAPVGGPGRQD
jgi:hypothetical protein